MKKLAILIPTIDSRKETFEKLLKELDRQVIKLNATDSVVIIANVDDGTLSIGSKRNALLKEGVERAHYVAFFDDDDYPGEQYIKYLLDGIRGGYDCCSLRGVMLTDGENPEMFEHSIRYNSWQTTGGPIKYERYPNHLNCIKSEIAKDYKFIEVDHGEDREWSTQIHEADALRSEYFIPDVIYVYQFNSKK